MAQAQVKATAVLTLKTALAGFALLGGLGSLGSLGVGAAIAAPVPLRVMAFNDFHGHLEAADLRLDLPDPANPGQWLRAPAGGAAALAGLVRELRADSPNHLLLSGGDLFGGSPLISSLFRHESTVAVMNRIGLDASVVGNHEFDAGWAELQRLINGGCAATQAGNPARSCANGPWGGAKFPLLGGNVVAEATGQIVLAPSVVRNVGGVRVGLIGAVTRTTPDIVMRSGIAGLRFDDEADAINRSAALLKAAGVHTLIALVHEGGEIGQASQRGDWNDGSCPKARGAIFEINRRLSPDIDLLLTGHTHQGYRCEMDGRLVMQATAYGRGLSVIDLVLDSDTGRVQRSQTRGLNVPVLNERVDPALRRQLAAGLPAPLARALLNAQPDAQVAAEVAALAQAVAPLANQPVGRITADFKRGGTGNGGPVDNAAGRLVADAQLAATRSPATGGAQLALMNQGGVRSDLECTAADKASGTPCTISYGQVITMQPFGNALVTMTLSGAQLQRVLESQQRANAQSPAILHPSAGLTYEWHASAEAGQHVRQLMLNGQPVLPEQRLRVTVNNFIADGGDGFTLLREGTERLTGPLDAEALVQFLGGSQPVQPDTQARVRWLP